MVVIKIAVALVVAHIHWQDTHHALIDCGWEVGYGKVQIGHHLGQHLLCSVIPFKAYCL